MVTVVSFLLDCALPMGRPARVATLAAVALLAFGGRALATEYPAWGDTGWIYASKAACCNEAIAIASRYSAEECANTGGVPSPFVGGGGQRGSCSWQWMQDPYGTTMNRCYGEASVWCDQ
jgi:hypothetical protein